MQRTLFEVVRRHEVLRTSFPSVDGQPRQRIVRWQPALPLIDLSGLDQAWPGSGQAAGAARGVAAFRPGDGAAAAGDSAAAGSRGACAFVHHASHRLGRVVHGPAGERSGGTYKAYQEGQESPLEELAVQYADYAVWQREWLAGEVLEEQLEYWRRQLAGRRRCWSCRWIGRGRECRVIGERLRSFA